MSIEWNEPHPPGLPPLSLNGEDVLYVAFTQQPSISVEVGGGATWLSLDNRGHHRFLVTVHSTTVTDNNPVFYLHAFDRLEVDLSDTEAFAVQLTDLALPTVQTPFADQTPFGMVSVTTANRRLRLLSPRRPERLLLDLQASISDGLGYTSIPYDTAGLSALEVRCFNNSAAALTLLVEREDGFGGYADEILRTTVNAAVRYNTDIGPGCRTPGSLGRSLRVSVPAWGAGTFTGNQLMVSAW